MPSCTPYRAFGFAVGSELSLNLPKLAPLSGAPDITVRIGASPPTDPEVSMARVDITGIARITARGGSSLVVDPEAGATEQVLGLAVLGLGMGMLLHQRGFVCIHAAALSRDRQAVLLLGDSGDGKSTLAAAMLARGWRLVSDDICALEQVQGSWTVRPSFPLLKLDEDGVAASEATADAATPPPEGLRKMQLTVASSFETRRCTVGSIVCLAEGPSIEVREMEVGAELLATVIRYSFMPDMITRRSAEYFGQAASLAAGVPFLRLVRPRSLAAVSATSEMLDRFLTATAR